MALKIGQHVLHHNGTTLVVHPPWVRIKADIATRGASFMGTDDSIITNVSARHSSAYKFEPGEVIEIPILEETTLYFIHEWTSHNPGPRLFVIRHEPDEES